MTGQHMENAQKMRRLFSGGLASLLSIYRLYDAALQLKGRRKAGLAADEATERIKSGEVSGKLQQARLGTLQELDEFGMLNPDAGPYVGLFEGHRIFLNSDKHIAVMGLSGSGKGITFGLINHIHQAMGGPNGGAKESRISVDVKNAEISWCTAEGAAALDPVPPGFINPWRMHGRPTLRVNFLQNIAVEAQAGRYVVDDLKARLRNIFGDMDAKGVNAWIPKAAFQIAEIVGLVYAYYEPEALTPGSLWDVSKWTHKEFGAFMQEAAELTACEGYVGLCARKLFDQYGREHTDQFEWVMEALGEAFGLYGPGSLLRDATSRTEIDFRLLKQRPQAVYIMIPDRYLKSHAAYVTAVLDYAIETIAHAPGDVRVSIWGDEWSSLPRSDNCMTWLRMYRELKIRLVTMAQDRNGYSMYKADGGFRPFEENSIRLYWGISDGQHLQDIERRAGYNSVLIEGRSTQVGVVAPGSGESAAEQVTPVLPVSEIGKIADGKAILDVPGRAIWIIDRDPFWTMPEWSPFIRDKVKEPPPL